MNEGEEIRFIDLFSGIGGFRLGLERANQASRQTLSKEKWRQTCGSDLRSPRYIASNKATNRRSQYTFNCVWSCDNNKYANQVYTKQFGEANHHPGDVRGVDPGEIPDFDLLCAGFPCQAFSVAGKRKGFQDTRGTLFFEISRIAEAKRPQMLLLENVKGLFSSDRGQTFQTILQELGRIGYWAEWQVLNSKHHGVPQNRERVFIVGHLRNGCSRPIFPIGETDEMAKKNVRGRSPVQPEVSTAIDGSYYKGVDRHGQRTVILDTFNRGKKEEEAYSLKTNPSPTSSAVLAILTDNLGGNIKDRIKNADKAPAWTLGGSSTKVAISFTNPHNPEEERKVNLSDTSRAVKPPYGNQQPFVAIGSEKPTVRAGGRGSLERHAWDTLTNGFRIRRLTPVECERLQGFPDGWTKWGYEKGNLIEYEDVYGEKVVQTDELDYYGEPEERTIWTVIGRKRLAPPLKDTIQISDTQRYKCLGNAVTTNVITFLGKRIMEAEK